MAIPIQVTFDCADPARVASFWAKALGYKLQDPPEGYASWPDFLTAIGVPEADWKKASAIVDRDAERDASAIQRWKANQDVVMRKVLVIGSGGAGKSTFAATLSRRTGLPLIHLDSLYWRPGWIETSAAEWDQTIEHLLGRDTWIMDGNFGRTLERRLAACDTVIFLDLPRLLCLQRIIRRRLQFHGRSRPDMREGCPERLSWEFIQWVWTYPERRRPGILARLAALEPEKQVVVLRSRGEVERFLALPTGCA